MRESQKYCSLCSGPLSVYYYGPIRDGLNGKIDSATVYECSLCGVQRLEEAFCKSDEWYRSGQYRIEVPYDKNLTLPLLTERLLALNCDIKSIENQKMLDVGAGHGWFLDVCKALGAKTYFTEINLGQRGRLKQRHGEPFMGGMDIVTLFDVIEHVSDPKRLLEEARSYANIGATFIVNTPFQAVGSDLSKYYRTQHRWYFHPESLSRLMKSVQTTYIDGFCSQKDKELQFYGIYSCP